MSCHPLSNHTISKVAGQSNLVKFSCQVVCFKLRVGSLIHYTAAATIWGNQFIYINDQISRLKGGKNNIHDDPHSQHYEQQHHDDDFFVSILSSSSPSSSKSITLLQWGVLTIQGNECIALWEIDIRRRKRGVNAHFRFYFLPKQKQQKKAKSNKELPQKTF